jgi:hypothetical protein
MGILSAYQFTKNHAAAQKKFIGNISDTDEGETIKGLYL